MTLIVKSTRAGVQAVPARGCSLVSIGKCILLLWHLLGRCFSRQFFHLGWTWHHLTHLCASAPWRMSRTFLATHWSTEVPALATDTREPGLRSGETDWYQMKGFLWNILEHLDSNQWSLLVTMEQSKSHLPSHQPLGKAPPGPATLLPALGQYIKIPNIRFNIIQSSQTKRMCWDVLSLII